MEYSETNTVSNQIAFLKKMVTANQMNHDTLFDIFSNYSRDSDSRKKEIKLTLSHPEFDLINQNLLLNSGINLKNELIKALEF